MDDCLKRLGIIAAVTGSITLFMVLNLYRHRKEEPVVMENVRLRLSLPFLCLGVTILMCVFID